MQRFLRTSAVVAIAALWPAWSFAADREIAQGIAESLRSSGQFSDYSIGVKYEEGTAWLLGRVADESQRDKAVAMTRGMPQVKNVVSKLEVRSTRAAPGTATSALRFASQAEEPAAPQNTGNVYPEADSRSLAASQADASATTLTAGQAPSNSGTPTPAGQTVTLNASNPGDPLAQSSQPRFALAPSRRFANAPVGVPAAAKPMAYPARQRPATSQQVAYSSEQRMQVPRGAAVAAQPVPYAAANGQPMPGYPATASGPPMNYAMAAMPQYCPPQGRQGPLAASPPGANAPAAVPAGFHHMPRGVPAYAPSMGGCVGGACAAPAMEQPNMPCYAWPSYASYPNYAAVTYPRQYSPTAWPYIGPFYPYPQVPLGWRKVCLEWDDGWWWLDFYDHHNHH